MIYDLAYITYIYKLYHLKFWKLKIGTSKTVNHAYRHRFKTKIFGEKMMKNEFIEEKISF